MAVPDVGLEVTAVRVGGEKRLMDRSGPFPERRERA